MQLTSPMFALHAGATALSQVLFLLASAINVYRTVFKAAL
jgi:hypothetical protein